MKKAKNLAKSYELGSCEYDFYNYIVDSYINGNKKQCFELYKEMIKADRLYFLNNYSNIPIEHDLYNNYLEVKNFIISQIV